MESEGDWVQVRFPTEIDMWSPSLVEMENPVPLKVQFSGPARFWTDALPIGNGRLGAMVWGGVASETLQLNDDTLWTGIPGNYTNPDAPKVLSRVRELVDNGQYVEATAASVKLLGDPTEVYQPLGDIKLEFDDSHSAYAEETYQRELDLDTAMVKMKYTVGDVEFTREHFASNPHQVIAMKLSASKSGALSFTVSLESKLHHHLYINSENQVILEGSCLGKRAPPKVNVNNNPKGIQFSAVLDLHISDGAGMIEVLDGKKLKVQNSNWAIIFLVASSSFDDSFTKPSDSERDPTSESLDKLRSIRHISYSDIYGHHLNDYQKLFCRVSLQLSKSSKSARGDLFKGMEKFEPSKTESYTEGVIAGIMSTAERVKSFKTDEDPSLVELLFQYGRYLLISCSRPGSQVANLQGIWNKDVEPKWEASPHLNINLQMNYWPSLPCNLQECQQPLFDYISSLSVNGAKTAHVNYEASGWVVHHVSDIWAKTSPGSRDPKWALWPMGGAWLCTHLWEHYAFTMDEGFLKNKAYTLLEGCASFLLDWLIEGHGGYLETNPSTSPEHNFIAPDGKPASVSYSSTMDMAIIRELFSTVISAAETLGRSNDILVKKVQKAQTRLRPTKIAGDGSIMEWAQGFEDPDVHHRHLSHLFGMFPGHTITADKTPDLYKAAANTLYKRGEEGPGWSTTWKIALWARLHDSEHAYNMVKHLINLVDPDKKIGFEGGLYSNLFTAHPPFQIDANFGFTAAVAEMLVQSTVKDLYLLPALPREKWPSGCVKGLKARGGVTVSICWTEGDLQEVGIWLKNRNSVRLHYNGIIVTAKLSSDTVYTFNRQLKCLKTHSLSEACFL